MISRAAGWLAVAALAAGLGLGWLVMRRVQAPSESGAARTPRPASSTLVGRPLPPLDAVTFWTGGGPPGDSLGGRVVVVALLSLNLPASLGALDHLESWHDAYARYGLRVIGVQVPEFAFAAEPPALAAAARRLGIGFPIGLDPSLAASHSFGGAGERPRLVIADPRGQVTFEGSGVEAFPDAEREIRALLEAARPELRFPAAAAPPRSASPEFHPPVHLGRARVAGGPLASTPTGRPETFTAQLRYQMEGRPYTPYPVGRWTLSADGLTAARGGAENFLALRYDAGALGAVLAPPESGPIRVWVLRDERWLPAGDAGADMRFDGRGASYVLVDEARWYALTREGAGPHVVKLSPDAPGAAFYALTFEPSAPAAAGP